MRVAIFPLGAALLLSGCATGQNAQAFNDYSNLSCRELSAELALTQRAFGSASKRARPASDGATAQAYMFPASFGTPPTVASAALQARLESLRRASRAKRCTSAWSQTGVA